MEQETTKVMKAKDYKRAGKAEAVSYIQRKKGAKGDERKTVVREQKQKIKDWKSGLKDLDKKERKLQKKAHKAYKKRMALPGTVAVWVVVLLIIGMIGNALSPIVTNLSHIMGQKYTDQTAEAQAARAAGEAFSTDISDEGIILLKNENDLLPLNNKKVNIFGDDAYNFKYSGGGSGAVDLTNCVTLFKGLEMAGIEYNPELDEMYRGMGYDAEASGTNNIVAMLLSFMVGTETKDINSNEYLTADVLASARAYYDQAIAPLQRILNT